MKRSERVDVLIRNNMIYATALGLIPVPWVDIIAVTAVQINMIKDICDEYDIDYNEAAVKTFVTALAGSTFAKIGASLIKSIPLIGTFIGGASMAVLSGASTYAVGKVFKKHFEEGGNLANFNADSWKKFYEEMFQEGKKEAEKVEENKGDYREIFQKLEKLAQLKEKGIITNEEFQKKKDELLKNL
ncbi:MAG: hypothetical protein KatS3mg035_0060 [Bacteroidia bacterium]|nr:MAG: hypothetical protein KatS3mg035_0060 [Bacteroidia bacterium]